MIKNLFIVFLLSSIFVSYSQKKDWFDKDYRESNWPKSEYYQKYSFYEIEELGDENSTYLEKENYAIDFIKQELSNKILVEVKVTQISVEETIDAKLSSIFKKISKSESDITFPGLKVKKQKKGKYLHVFIYIKKDDLKEFAKSRFETWVSTLKGQLDACRNLKKSGVYQQALEMANQIYDDKKVLDKLSNLLLALTVSVDRTQFDKIQSDLSFLKGYLEDKVQVTSQYHHLKNQAENIIGNNISELEKKQDLLENCKNIAPDLAKQDGISEMLELTKDNLFNLYCIEASNSEELKKWEQAILFYEKANNIDPTKKINNTNETPIKLLIQCKEKFQEDLTELGKKEYKAKNFEEAKDYFEQAKEIIKTLNDNSKDLDKINKEINRCNKKISNSSDIYKNNNTNNQKSKIEKTPARILIRLSGGWNSYLQDWESFNFDELDFNSQARHVSAFLGYRFNLPDEVRISNRGRYDRSKGNAFGVFFKNGHDYFWDDSFRSFYEFEIGLMWREILRLSIGPGFVNQDLEDITLNDIPYYVGTLGLSVNLGQFFIAPSVSYLSKEQATITGDDKIRVNIALGFRLLLFREKK